MPPEDQTPPNVTPPANEPNTTPKETPEEKLSKIQADLDRRDRELYAKEGAIKAYQKQLDEYGNLKKMASEKPIDAIRAIGLDPLALANAMLGEPPPRNETSPELEALKKELGDLKAIINRTHQQTQKDVEYAKIKNLISGNAKKYEVLDALRQEGDTIVHETWGRLEKIFGETGKVPDYTQLLDNLENEYSEKIKPTLTRLTKIEKLKKEIEKLEGNRKPDLFKTLSNRDTQDGRKEMVFMTDEEKEQQALKILRDSYKGLREKRE